mmetsp:Transcript_20663/g.40371  ORF Transcript_20663/g.40371 Transcript_20663/m.40371 type:complete len:130 (-) Transcript_20663:466-855(-)
MALSPPAPQRGDEGDFFGANGNDVRAATLDVCDGTWQPKGIDAFICEARVRQNRGCRTSRHLQPVRTPTRRTTNLRKAAALFNQLENRAAAMAALESSPASVASESEDEAAPLAMIPPPPPVSVAAAAT